MHSSLFKSNIRCSPFAQRYLLTGFAPNVTLSAWISLRSFFPLDVHVQNAVLLHCTTLTLPRFTPEGVTAVAQWGLVCLIGYWLLTIVLRLLISVLKHVFWTVKTVLALWAFGLIVLDKSASTDTTAFRLGGLVLTCVLLSLYTSDFNKQSAVEKRLSNLEGRLKAVEKK
uniref:Uncharacterized protein n=1 Tax=Oryzias melastigma TaxID=30732 RepID=A0A3B3D3L2_ORYME